MNAMIATFFLLGGMGMDNLADTLPEEESEFIESYRDAVENSGMNSTVIDSDSIALAIEWLRMRDAVSSGQTEDQSDYFLGYLCGRVRMDPPSWWTRQLKREVAAWWKKQHKREVVKPNAEKPHPSRKSVNFEFWQENEQGWIFNGFDKVEVVSNGLLLEKDARRVVLDKDDFPALQDDSDEWNTSDGAIAGAFGDDICAIAFECDSSGPGGPYMLYCVDIKTGKPLWKRNLHHGLGQVGFSGPGVNNTQITIDEKHIAVWTAHMSFNLQVFDIGDGKRRTSLVTGYLNGIESKKTTEHE